MGQNVWFLQLRVYVQEVLVQKVDRDYWKLYWKLVFFKIGWFFEKYSNNFKQLYL